MTKYHPLTEKIKRIAFEKPSHHVEELDSIIREDREKLAKELSILLDAVYFHGRGDGLIGNKSEVSKKGLFKILGLTDGGEVGDSYCNKCKKNLRDCKCPERSSAPYGEWGDAPEKPKQKWCEHLPNKDVWVIRDGVQSDALRAVIGMGFKFCPICGTPRPKEKTLVEKVVDALKCRSFCKNLIDEEVVNIAKTVIAVMEKEMGK